MDSVSFHATNQLETKLSGIYEILYRKKSEIAEKINRHTEKETETKKCNNVCQALYFHLTLNLCVIAGLFYLLF
ncbi:MAG: hypothetical protein GY951_04695 [Psychromonas sp.]|nr:hypothetical protein [Alteromonadales bacterium]MCP5077338.1 hypothetical protein [Psychromonas sp.]